MSFPQEQSSEIVTDQPVISGFLTPALFNQEIANFFAKANIGPLVTGSFVERERYGITRMIPDVESLEVSEQKLNDVLDFTKPEINGETNPSYRIFASGSLTPLFALHAYYGKMQHADTATRLSASQEMRQYLRQTMIDTIEEDADRILQFHTGDQLIIRQVNVAKPILINNIDNPDNVVPKLGQILSEDGETLIGSIFDPNYFLYAHFSRLIMAGKVSSLNSEVDLTEQQDSIALSRAYKNEIQKRQRVKNTL